MSILNRTVYFEKDASGICRFSDWATVTTTIGAMAEPFVANERYGFGPYQDFDPSDEIVRVDNIRAIVDGQDFKFLTNSGEPQFTGGVLQPKTGR